ncbi:MAG TPA: MASE3 domain-containing protein, partial [bacterium]|nr:MASE3 domain-containing protein [bacterium]
VGYCFTAILDIQHLLFYPGMTIIKTAKSNTSAQLWVAARLVETLTLVSLVFCCKKINKYLLLFVFGGLFIFLNLIIYFKIFPVCFVENVGLTDFKIYAEYSFVFLLLITLLFINQTQSFLDKNSIRYLKLSIVFFIISELNFTLYKDIYGFFNVLGHFFKIISYYFIYLAIIKEILIMPFNIIFKNLENEKRQLENKYETLLEYLPQKIFFKDKNLKYVSCNNNYANTLNIEKYKIIGKTDFDFFPKETAEKYQRSDKKIIETNMPDYFEEQYILNNATHWQSITKMPIKNPKGEIIGIIGIIEDITEKKKLFEQLIHSEKLSAIGRLAAGIAHEFNNILTIIYNAAQVVEIDNYQITPDLTKIIIDTTLRGSDIVKNIMAFAKPRELKKDLIKIEDVIDEVLKFQSNQFVLDRIEIIKNYENTQKIFIDKGQFHQVFLNLIINARHAILPKGKGVISISTVHKNNYIEIKISDSGIGIENKFLSRIFEPFFTTKGAYAKDNLGLKGTGLGLTVTESIIKNHNGSITVESEKGIGTTFIIHLPVPENNNNQKTEQTNKITSQNFQKSLKILIIDDEKVFAELFAKLLKHHNCEVQYSTSGADGLKKFQENKFDIVFLDMLLPDMKGENIFQALKKIDKNIPIVFISGQITLEIENLKNLGAFGFIQKPFDIEEIKKLLIELENKIN